MPRWFRSQQQPQIEETTTVVTNPLHQRRIQAQSDSSNLLTKADINTINSALKPTKEKFDLYKYKNDSLYRDRVYDNVSQYKTNVKTHAFQSLITNVKSLMFGNWLDKSIAWGSTLGFTLITGVAMAVIGLSNPPLAAIGTAAFVVAIAVVPLACKAVDAYNDIRYKKCSSTLDKLDNISQQVEMVEDPNRIVSSPQLQRTRTRAATIEDNDPVNISQHPRSAASPNPQQSRSINVQVSADPQEHFERINSAVSRLEAERRAEGPTQPGDRATYTPTHTRR